MSVERKVEEGNNEKQDQNERASFKKIMERLKLVTDWANLTTALAKLAKVAFEWTIIYLTLNP